jgi:hypothetical protein
MPNNTVRAWKEFFRNIWNSELSYLITERGLVSLAERHGSPELASFVRANIRPVWDWIDRNLINRR